MNREQLIEKATKVGASARRGVTAKINDTDWQVGKAVVDAILPQVSTVEELGALPPDTVAVSDHGTSWTRVAPRGWPMQWYGVTRGYCTSEVALAAGPLTVVWTPEVDHG